MTRLHNRLTFGHARSLTEAAIKDLSVDDIVALQDDLAERVDAIATDTALFSTIVGLRFTAMAQNSYKAEAKDTGKITVSIDKRFDLVGQISKTVAWDQSKLAALYAKIEQSGDNPEVYIKRNVSTAYTVPEAVFKAWPDDIKKVFLSARTVNAGDLKITIQPKKGTP